MLTHGQSVRSSGSKRKVSASNPPKALERRCRKALDGKNKRLRKITDNRQSGAGYVITDAFSGAIVAGEDKALTLLDVCLYCGGRLARDAERLLISKA